MLTVTTIAGVRARREEVGRTGVRIAFVPTMGALHDGHLALVRRGREIADEVWASVFVNPAQFAPGEDFARYPRDLEGDREMLAAAGASVLFAPATKEIFPRPPATVIDLPALTGGLCGAQRPGHFRGVALVVAKLLNIVQPHVAVFGAKDWQQGAVIRRMVADLDMPVRIEVHPTVREDDGLARSSRNAYLDVDQRRAAVVLHRALQRGAGAAAAGERRGAALEALLADEVSGEPLARLEYAAAVDPDTLQPLENVRGRLLLALAVRVGATRLIDNLLVEVS
ncbi:MAG: pantoate--beta-alanine ligase [Thermoanaerobaculaceae bacterium]|nr:pantoate--beta-alanine ligase [Thermoanaerobaculaceae bacterium]TAM46799.1 MAG: pantoate--beta-alanine ligase [Acidobacteriota bacterium]